MNKLRQKSCNFGKKTKT